MNSHDNPVALPDWPNSATTRYSVNEIPARARAAGRSLETCMAEVRRQLAIPVGRGTEANRAARELAGEWFGADVAMRLAVSRTHRRKRRAGAPVEFPFGALAPSEAA